VSDNEDKKYRYACLRDLTQDTHDTTFSIFLTFGICTIEALVNVPLEGRTGHIHARYFTIYIFQGCCSPLIQIIVTSGLLRFAKRTSKKRKESNMSSSTGTTSVAESGVLSDAENVNDEIDDDNVK